MDTGASLLEVADASGSGHARCEGCDDIKDIDTWDIEELELHAGGDWGHYTIYSTSQGNTFPAQSVKVNLRLTHLGRISRLQNDARGRRAASGQVHARRRQ